MDRKLNNNLNQYRPIRFLKPYRFFVIIFLFFSTQLFAQKGYLIGKVINQENKKGVPSATVTNKNSKQITKTNGAGEFFIWANMGDSIKTSSIGYADAGIMWDGITKEPVIEAKPIAIMLGEVVVKTQRPENLRKEIDEFLKDPDWATTMKKNAINRMVGMNTSNGQPGMTLSIDALYEIFSKEGKSKRKLAALEQKDLEEFYLNARYNKEFVGYVTKLQGKDLDRLIDFCPLPRDFILRSSDYELTYAILQCFREFQSR
jgi:hypothetical protein